MPATGAMALAAAAAFAVWAHLAAALGAHPPNFFDGALFLLQAMFPARGLVPYGDAGFVYPPGVGLLFGEWLGLRDPPAIRAAAWAVSAILAVLNASLLARLAAPGLRAMAAGLLLGVAALMALYQGANSVEPITPGLGTLLLLVTLAALRHGATPGRLATLLLAAAAATLFRWDRALAVALMLAGAAAVTALAPCLLPGLRTGAAVLWRDARRLLACAAAIGSGVALGGLAVLAHAWHHGVLAQAIDWILVIPLAILPYRQLPLPVPAGPFDLQAQWIAALLCLNAIAVGALLAFRPWTMPGGARLAESGVLLAVPLALLPYAFGRADEAHFLPLTLSAATAASVAFVRWPRPGRSAALAGLGLLAVPLAHDAALRGTAIGLLPQAGLADWTAEGWTAGCTPLFPPGARALFVGQDSYAQFIVNVPLFHVVRPDLRPATSFIAEEPGLQNTCRWGAAVAAQLAAAPRPMLALLDTAAQPPEPNATRAMRSCGHIEAALRTMPHHDLGLCPFGARQFRVVLYD